MLAEPARGGEEVVALAGGLSHAEFVEMRVNLDAYRIASEPFYQPVGDEIAVFEAAFSERLPVMLKGPTGCGKTRFVEHMAPG
jgi:MoxR-like ATPase